MEQFRNRDEAGARLAAALSGVALTDPVVLALPRGGVPVAVPVADALGAPLDVILVRKIGMPGHEELAAGAIVDGDAPVVVFNDEVLRLSGLTEDAFTETIAEKQQEIEDRRARYFGPRAPVPVAGRSAIVVDDGIATGMTVEAALRALRARGPAEIVLAVPVAPPDTLKRLQPLVDRIVVLETPRPFYAVGAHYTRFEQVSDAEVVAALERARTPARKEGKDHDA